MRVHDSVTPHPLSARCPLRWYFVEKFTFSAELMVSYFYLMIGATSSRSTISLWCAFASGKPVPPRPVYWIASCIGVEPFLSCIAHRRHGRPLTAAAQRGATASQYCCRWYFDRRPRRSGTQRSPLLRADSTCASPARHRRHSEEARRRGGSSRDHPRPSNRAATSRVSPGRGPRACRNQPIGVD